MNVREFDLNIEKVLENWTVAHALREVIANALDEQVLTNTADIKISKDEKGCWHFRDFGRGLKHIHLTQNENAEKLNHPNLIGKFGVGLKDALATFDRHEIAVAIDSRYGHITIGKSAKHGFTDIVTLHAYITPSQHSDFIGTEFVIRGCSDDDVLTAKNFFLRFSDLKLLEKTQYGEIYPKRDGVAEVFINGIKVSEEDNLLFSYNITSLNATLRKAINRERTNVGRAAYADRIKSILLNVKSSAVIDALTENLSQMSSGRQCDEMKWVDVQTYAVKFLNARKETVFVTPDEVHGSSGRILEIIKDSGKIPVFIPNTVKRKIENERDVNGYAIETINTVVKSYQQSFEYEFVSYSELNEREKSVYDLIPMVMAAVGTKIRASQIFISSKMHQSDDGWVLGVWEPEKRRVIILRSQLANREQFLGTLIHELTHADSGSPDISREFECALTERLGRLASMLITSNSDCVPDCSQEEVIEHYRQEKHRDTKSEVMRKRKAALENRLQEQSRKRDKLFDARQFAELTGVTSLSDVPTDIQEDDLPTMEMVDRLERLGLVCPGSQSAAVKLLVAYQQRVNSGLATHKQIRFLSSRGFRNVKDWKLTDAAALVNRIAAQGRNRLPPDVDPETYIP